MCECSKGYTCPQHVARVNAAGVAKQRKPKGMTIRQAVAVMQANRGHSRVFARNEETEAAARILMGAYFSSGERGCPSFQQIFERFSVTVTAPSKISVANTYEIGHNVVGYYVMYKGGGSTRYLDKYGGERTSCNAAHVPDGTCGYFKLRTDAENAIAAHKDKSHGHKWEKLVRELPARSFTIERQTIAAAANRLLRNVSQTEISEKLKDSGFKDVRPEHVVLTIPISEIGYYKVLIKFNSASQVYISLWVVPK